MSYRLVYHETLECPAEYESDNPATCAACGLEFDLDEDDYNELEIGGKIRYFCDDCGEPDEDEDEE